MLVCYVRQGGGQNGNVTFRYIEGRSKMTKLALRNFWTDPYIVVYLVTVEKVEDLSIYIVKITKK